MTRGTALVTGGENMAALAIGGPAILIDGARLEASDVACARTEHVNTVQARTIDQNDRGHQSTDAAMFSPPVTSAVGHRVMPRRSAHDAPRQFRDRPAFQAATGYAAALSEHAGYFLRRFLLCRLPLAGRAPGRGGATVEAAPEVSSTAAGR